MVALIRSAVVVPLLLCWSLSVQSAITAILPFPGDETGAVFGTFTDPMGVNRDAILLDGIPIAFKYDDTWSYSAPVLNALQDAGFIPASYGDYQFATGVGTQDAVLFTQAGGQDNNPVGAGDCCILEDPGPTTAGSTVFVEAWWGQDDQDNDGTPDGGIDGPNTVGEILDFLHSTNPANDIPVFYTDWNQTGESASLLISVEVQILDPGASNAEVAHWSLDTANNGVYDPLAMALNFGQISFYGSVADCAANPDCAGVTASGNEYTDLSHNVGSGAPDFIAFAPDMDLSLFDPNYLFVVHLRLGCEGGIGLDGQVGGLGCGNNGGEEIFMTGRVAPDITRIPEPISMALFLVGLVCLRLSRRPQPAIA